MLDWIFTKLPLKFAIPTWLAWIGHNQIVISWTLIAVFFIAFALRIPPTENGVITAFIASAIAVIALACVASFVRVHHSTKTK